MNKGLIFVLIVTALLLTSQICSQPYFQSLFPGQTVKCDSINVKWNVPEYKSRDIQTSPSFHSIDFIGKDASVKNVSLDDKFIYLEETVIWTNPSNSNPYVLPKTIELKWMNQPSEYTEEGVKQHLRTKYISRFCPIVIGRWKISIPEKTKTFPDGSEYKSLKIQNFETGESEENPILEGVSSSVKFDRVTIQIRDYCKATETVRTQITLEEDPSLKGRYALFSDWYDLKGPLEEVVKDLGDQFGFEVEWEADPDYPEESLKYLKDINFSEGGRYAGAQFLDYILSQKILNHPYVAGEWKDNHTLVLRPENYDGVLENKRKEQERLAENEKTRKRFEEEYKTVTKVYKLERVSPETIKQLIVKEITSYHLVLYRYGKAVIMKGESVNNLEDDDKIEESVMEEVAVDKERNALIVSAIPATHQKIREKIDSISGIIDQSQETRDIIPRRIFVTLLGGIKSENMDEEKIGESRKLMEDLGINPEDIDFLKKGEIYKMGSASLNIIPDEGATASAMMGRYEFNLEFIGERGQFLVVQASLKGRVDAFDTKGASFETRKEILDNTVYLEPGKTTTMGVTDLEKALILVLSLKE